MALAPDLETAVGTSGLARLISAALQTGLALLVASSIGVGVAIRTNAVPPFDWQLTLDDQYILAIHDGPVCQAMPGIPTGACADYLPDLREFTITYRTPQTNWLLLSALLPER
ncbi:MAG TPA: hypothetical protein VGJ87_19355 [Roseiflexaceae bacterium]|jgi:hypothetical protein